MSTKKVLLAVLAHPDDESFGPGGTLAKYAALGAEVHIVIATDGSAGSVVKGYEEERARLADVRRGELAAAVAILGGQLHMLGYRDSGYKGDTANNGHPEAFINGDMEEQVGRIVALLRTLRPQVVLTHDEMGGYYHPDHIRCYEITTAAFGAAGEASRYPAIGPAPWQPARLYYTAFPRARVRRLTLEMRLRGQDPTRMGRNKDIDFTQLGVPAARLHAQIDVRGAFATKRAASAEHKSQGGGGMGRSYPVWLQKLIFGKEYFIRAYPPVRDGFRERDLFGPNGA